MKSDRNWCIVQLPDGRMATTDLPMSVKEGEFSYTEVDKFIGGIGDTKVKLVKIMLKNFDSLSSLISDPPKNGDYYERDEIVLQYLPEYSKLVHSTGVPFDDPDDGFRLVIIATTASVSSSKYNCFIIRAFKVGVDINLNDKFTPGFVIGIGKKIYTGNKKETLVQYVKELSKNLSNSFINEFYTEMSIDNFIVKKSRFTEYPVMRLVKDYIPNNKNRLK